MKGDMQRWKRCVAVCALTESDSGFTPVDYDSDPDLLAELTQQAKRAADQPTAATAKTSVKLGNKAAQKWVKPKPTHAAAAASVKWKDAESKDLAKLAESNERCSPPPLQIVPCAQTPAQPASCVRMRTRSSTASTSVIKDASHDLETITNHSDPRARHCVSHHSRAQPSVRQHPLCARSLGHSFVISRSSQNRPRLRFCGRQ